MSDSDLRAAAERLRRYEHVQCGQCGAKHVRLYRPGGEFRRAERDRCLSHITDEQTGYYIPLVLREDGEAWGFTSATEPDIELWKQMPEAVAGLSRCANVEIMRTYLASVRADDEEAIDEAWLREAGGIQVPPGYEFCGQGISVRVIALNNYYDAIEIHQDESNVLAVYEKKLQTTRGQLRLLCRALGITLKEPS